MSRIRCKECGMSLDVHPGDIFIKCPICGATTVVTKNSLIPSVDDLYDSQNYHADSEEHAKDHVYVDRVEEEKNEMKPEEKSVEEKIKKVLNLSPATEKSTKVAVGIVVFVLSFILLFWMVMLFSI